MALSVPEPSFGRLVIDDDRSDGYWVETFHFSSDERVPGIIASGLVSGNVEFLDNPLATEEGADSQSTGFAVVVCDLTGNGLTDVVICHDYGPFMLECNMAGGWISWLENPGRDKLGSGMWKQRKIGRWPAMHRLSAGHFTQRTEWQREIIDDEHFTVIHEISTVKYVSEGDPMAYIATLDPFHGIAACVYTQIKKGPQASQWKRHVLDVYGTPTQLQKTGDGPGHYVVCADFDGDGDDEFILSLFGSMNRDDSGETIKVNSKNFGGIGKLDIISVRYNVARYYEEPQPIITLHLNEFAEANANGAREAIVPTLWDSEGLVYLARPSDVRVAQRLPLIEVAHYALSVEIHPKGSKIELEQGEGIKVLYGSVSDGGNIRSAVNADPFPQITPVASNHTMLSTDDESGTILLRIVPIGKADTWRTAQEVPVKTTFDTSRFGINFPELQFKKVEELWWGSGFKGVDFYNLSGFSFRFLDDKTHIAHLQFWAAGTNVNCGVHNHIGAMFQEVHICLSPGTQNGGMSRLQGDKYAADEEQSFEHIPIPRLYEHGGMWHRDTNGNPIRGKNNVITYPWHKWQGGSGPNVDVWMAVEFNPNVGS
ncbi:hypothetical protein DL771_005581 [Monosporascus sp. 5C6A]|nr:hypothetical protein DL771_005581 [Monosporascus sp. 5C6A]